MFFSWGLQHRVVPNIEAIILFYHNFCISLILAMIGVLSLLTCIPSLRQRERQKAIFYFQIPHNTLCLPLKFCKTIVFKCSWEYYVFPRVFEDHTLCKIWGANSVLWGIRTK